MVPLQISTKRSRLLVPLVFIKLPEGFDENANVSFGELRELAGGDEVFPHELSPPFWVQEPHDLKIVHSETVFESGHLEERGPLYFSGVVLIHNADEFFDFLFSGTLNNVSIQQTIHKKTIEIRRFSFIPVPSS